MNILIKPIITEKSLKMTKKGYYTFAVDSLANKNQIKEALEKQFNVEVLNIKTIKIPPKIKKIRARIGQTVVRPAWKKAIVKLNKEQKIKFFEVSS